MDPSAYKTVTTGVPPFFALKFARESVRNWDKFYKRNEARFFRDRHWPLRSATDGFPCLLAPSPSGAPVLVVEAGCGAANLAFPLLAACPHVRVHMFDFSPRAIALVRQSARFDASRAHAFVWDFARSPFASVGDDAGGLLPASADFCLLVFVLGAVPPSVQADAVRAVGGLLREGGRLLFRDYATGDMAHERFAAGSKIDENYYVRQDGTLSYFFDEERLDALMATAGLTKIYARRVDRLIKNRKEGLEMKRVFLQGEYRKDVAPADKDTAHRSSSG